MARFRLQKPAACSGCPLRDIGQGFSEPEGTATNGVALIGEACGEHEAIEGLPFRPHAEGGSLLNRALKMAGTDRAQYGIFNVIACRPPLNELVGASYEAEAIAHCRVHLLNALNKMQPKAIVAIGAVAARALTGLTGDRLSLEYIRGFALDSNVVLKGQNHVIPVIPTYHPIFIKRGNWAMLPVLAKDINYATQVAKFGALPSDNLRYVTDANVSDLEGLRDEIRANPDIAVSSDIETDYAELKEAVFKEDPELEETPVERIELMRRVEERKQTVTQVNFSIQEGTAVVAFATPGNMWLIKEIHATENVKVGHNIWMYDKPHCEENGIPFSGPIEDTMFRFHWVYPDLPGKRGKMVKGGDRSEDGSVANLQFCASFYGFPFPWKHLSGSDPGWYGAADGDSALRVFWGTQTDMDQLGIADAYQLRSGQLFFKMLENMHRRGMPTSRDGLTALHFELLKEITRIDGEIQQVVPREILPLHPKVGWKKAPKGAEAGKIVSVRMVKKGVPFTVPASLIQVEVDLQAERRICCLRARKPSKKTGLVDSKYVTSPRAHLRGETLYAPNPDCDKCGGTGVIELPDRSERRWASELPFNVASRDQMWAYCHYRGYQVPKNSKRKAAMDAEVIEKLHKRYDDPLMGFCVAKRRYVKLDSTYVGGWMPGSDGRVHPQIGPYPSSGQLAGRKPNPQNVMALSKIGDRGKLLEALEEATATYERSRLQDKMELLRFSTMFRNSLHAEPGHTIVEGDFSGFHVGTLGFEAGDPDYIRLSKIDIHSFFAVTGLLRVERADALLSMADQELKAKLKHYRKNYSLKDGTPFETIRNKQAKVAVLAYGLGQGHHSLYLQNSDSFRNPGEAERVIQAMNATFPKERLYRETMPLTAKPNGYKLVNRFGFIRWFFDVMRYNFRKGEWAHGDDFEAAIAFNVQASAHGHLRECCMINEQLGYNERYQFDNTVHDSLRFHCPTHLVEECKHNVGAVMEAPSQVMLCPWDENKGMTFLAEWKAGKNWGDGMVSI